MPSADDTRPDAPEPPSGPVERPDAEPLDLIGRIECVEAENDRLRGELAVAVESTNHLHDLVRRLIDVVEGGSRLPGRPRTHCTSRR